MNFEPQKFFIGLMDFFSILLPGAVLTYFAKDKLGAQLLDRQLGGMSDVEAGLVFFFSSYLLGHFIFLLGSWLDELYDLARGQSQVRRLKVLARWGTLQPKWRRFLLWLVFKGEKDQAVERAGAIKQHYLKPLGAANAVNTFQWAKLRLALDKPEVLAPVQRFEADSKFFRSLIVVLLLLPFVVGPQRRHDFAAYWVVFLLLATWRYMEQRHKATSQAYWAVLALEGHADKVKLPARERKPDEPTHAGGFVFRTTRDGGVEWLLVESRDDQDEWVLPKGHVEPGENRRLTAVREVREETGVLACIRKRLEVSSYRVDDEDVRVEFYLMEKLEQWRPTDPLRRAAWYRLEDARKEVRSEENKRLFDLAEATRITLPRAGRSRWAPASSASSST